MGIRANGAEGWHMPRFSYEELQQPVPDMDSLRELKASQGYGNIPIDTSDIRFDEPVVGIYELGLAGQSYYSRPNAATGEAVAEVPHEPVVRRGVAERLQTINNALNHPGVEEFFGAPVELYIEDALRPIGLQTRLHDEVFPALLRKNHPGITDEDLRARIKDLIAVGSADPLKPSPHATGAAVDVILRYKQADQGYVPGVLVPMGHEDGETSQRINPDYFEWQEPASADEALARRNRRAYYAIMSGAAFGFDSGLAVNPTEFWHWSMGDQLAALVRNEPAAYYSIAPVNS